MRWLRGGPTWRRWVVRLVVAVVGIYFLYLVVMNAVLMTGTMTSYLNDQQDNVTITTSSAYTYWFGSVHTRDLKIVVQEDDIEVLVQFPEASATLHVLKMPDLVCHLGDVRGTDGEIFVRQRVPKADASDHRMAGLPDIPGGEVLIDAPVPPDDDFSNNWTIHMADIDATIKTLWVDNVRVDGHLHLTGGYEWAAAQWVRFDRAEVDMTDAQVVLAGELAVERVDGKVSIDSERLAQSPPMSMSELIKRTELEAKLTAQSSHLDAFEWLLPPSEPVRLQKGVVVLDIDAALRDGELSKDSHASAVIKDYRMMFDDRLIRGAGTVALDISDLESAAAFDLSGAMERPDGKVVVSANPVEGQLRWTGRSIDDLGRVPAVDFIADVAAPNLSTLPSLGDSVALVGGLATARVETHLGTSGAGTTEVKATGERLTLGFGKLVYQIDLKTQISLQHDGAGEVAGNGKLSLDNFASRSDNEPFEQSEWSADIELYQVAFSDLGERSITLAARGTADGLQPIFNLPVLDDAIPDVPVALVDLEHLSFDAGFAQRGDVKEFKLWRASTDGVKAMGRLLTKGDASSGAFFVDAPLVNLGLSIRTAGVDVTLNPDEDWEKTHLDQLRSKYPSPPRN